DLIDHIAALVDRSLVVASADDPPRYRLLETMRAFALDELALAREDDDARKRHAVAVQALFARYIVGEPVLSALCEAEMENARAALAWARANDLALAAGLSAQGARASTYTVWRSEAGDWMEHLEPAMRSSAARALPAATQATWWTEYARLLGMRYDTRGTAAARHAVELWATQQQPHRTLFANVVW